MNTLARLLSSGVKAEWFRMLLGLCPQELRVRELVHQSGFAVSTIRPKLKNLVQLRVVEARRNGNRTYCHENSELPITQL